MAFLNRKPEVTIDTVRHLVGLLKKLASKLGGFAGSTSTAADPTCDHLAGLDNAPSIFRGVVVRSGFGSYDCEVKAPNGNIIVCSALAQTLHDTMGVSQSFVPVPGSNVLVYVPVVGLSRQGSAEGYILGVIPDNGTGGLSSNGEPAVNKIADTEFAEGGVSQLTESGPASAAADDKYPHSGDYQCGRPHDIVPGEYALLGHSGAGVIIGAIATCVRGSELASVRCSALDDQVRINSGHFRHIHAAGSDEIYDDGGFISIESGVSLYQPERLGVKAVGDPAFTWQEGQDLESLKETSNGIVPNKPTQTAKKRFYRYAGYLGDIVNVFVSNPDPSKAVEDMASASKDQGLFHAHLDTSGRFTMRSASGILLERYDRIPVPKRRHYPWDPEGDDATKNEPQAKKGFSVKDGHPGGTGLVLGDMAAWWDSLSYARVREFNKDFDVPVQKDLRCPDATYDENGHGTEDLQEYDKRHSYVALTPNGGIVLRDAWGSEIVMADGKITFNAAANIEIRSGSSVVILGGDDVVAKAYNSIDLSATKKDVRIKAEANMQLVSMLRGILIQSKAKGGEPDWSRVGEDLQSTGVIIKADESAIALVGQSAGLQGSKGVNIAAFDKDGKPSGNVVLSGRQISGAADSSVVLTAKGTSGLILTEQAAVLCAPAVTALGGRSAAEAAGNKLMLGIPVDSPVNLYTQTVETCKSIVRLYLDSTEWLNPFPPDVFSKVEFLFRTPEQYGTDRDSGLTGGVFSVYQPSWAVMAGSGRQWMKACKTKAWDEGKDAQGGYPWPGKAVMEGGTGYVTYKERNVDSSGLEDPKTEAAELTRAAFKQYHIRENS